ncbi:MAG TPA: hypothetical protein VGL62_09165 [Vicinamibacterales bacterium]
MKVTRFRFFAAIGVILFTASAHAEGVCRPLAEVRAAAAGASRWIELTPEQWQFARGMFVLNPNTPAGLPYGDKAELVQQAGDKDGVVLFLDGDKGCMPMLMPAEGVDLLMRVGSGEIAHEGTPD